MMDLNHWQKAVQIQLSAFELLLKNVLKQPYSIEVQNSETGSNEDAEQEMRKADVIIRFVEKNFNSKIFLGFSKNWISALTNQPSDTKVQNKESDDDAVLGLSSKLMEIIFGAMAEVGMKIEIESTDIIKEKELSDSFGSQKYFLSDLTVESALEENGKESTLPLQTWIAFSEPNEQQAEEFLNKFEDDNPFTDDRYSKIVNRLARNAAGAEDSSDNNDYNASISTKGQEVEFEDFGNTKAIKNSHNVRNIDLPKDVEMHVSVELGSRKMPLGHILQLVKGSVIELEKLAGEPVDILVNGHKIAQGDVVVIDEHFGVRISNLLASHERIKELQ